jgi:hypothetical protein
MAECLGQSSSRAAGCWDQGLVTCIFNELIGRTSRHRWRGGMLVGGLDFPITHDTKIMAVKERLHQRRQRRSTSSAGWVVVFGRVVVFVSHAIAVSFDE